MVGLSKNSSCNSAWKLFPANSQNNKLKLQWYSMQIFCWVRTNSKKKNQKFKSFLILGDAVSTVTVSIRVLWLRPSLISSSRSPSLGTCNYPTFLSRCFHRPIYFYLELTSQEPHWTITSTDFNIINKHGLLTFNTFNWRHHFTFFPLPMRAHADRNWSLSREKKLKNRPVCKGVVTQAWRER